MQSPKKSYESKRGSHRPGAGKSGQGKRIAGSAFAGCLNYDLHESVEQPGLLFFYENWMNSAELARHFETSHVKEALKKAEALLAEPLEIQNLSLISRPEFKPKAGVLARSEEER